MKNKNKLLIANRSEIACRVIQACRELGIPSVCIYTSEDAMSRHVTLSDEAIQVSSYLNSRDIVNAAKSSHANLIHPGYGFLSERSEFASAIEKAGLTFIGPRSESMNLMGEKISAKKTAEKAGVPTLPWAQVTSTSELKNTATEIGFPLLIKAASGGGGKGMRRVHTIDELEAAAESASQEAKAAFGDGTLFLERFIEKPRHIEVQVFGSGKGDGLHLFERDCTLQRRHQKVWEEAQAPNLTEKTRKKLYEASIRLVQEIEYRSAGTMEFLVDENENFYFLEMNTRLQVEHPVTEWITSTDLVQWQILLALDSNSWNQLSVEDPKGHSIEVRLYAEDPNQGFLPTPGHVRKLIWPTGTGIRIESGIEEGQEVSTSFDPMLAKLVVWAENRNYCISRLKYALEETVILGVGTNQNFLLQLCNEKEVLEGQVHTNYIENDFLVKRHPFKDETLSLIPSLRKTARPHSLQVQNATQVPSPWHSIGDLNE